MKNPRAEPFTFNYLVQAEENYDGLTLLVNGIGTDFFMTGTEQTKYQEDTLMLKEGTNRIMFVFSNDSADEGDIGFNKAYIDTVHNSFVNSDPIAKLNSTDYTVEVNQELILDATKSEDADGDIISYKWQLVGVGESLGSTLDDITSAKAKFIAGDKAGTITIKVTTTGQYGGTSSQNGSVTVTKKNGGSGEFIMIFSLLILSLRGRKQ